MEPEYRGHTRWTKSSVKKGARVPRTTTHARVRAFFEGGKDEKNAAERIDDANYVRVFFSGYETPKDARRLKLPSIGRISLCKADTDTPPSGESSKLPE